MTAPPRTTAWPAADWQPALLLATAGLACVLLGGGALWLLVRRMAGAFERAPAPTALLAVVAVALMLAVAARLCAVRAAQQTPPLFWLWGLPTAGLLMLAIALFPGQRWLWFVALAAAVVGEEVWAWFVAPPWGLSPVGWRMGAPQAATTPAPPSIGAVARTGDQRGTEVDTETDSEEELEGEADEEPALLKDVTQQLTRRVTDAGTEISALVQTTFAPGQRTAVEHLAFCPPFDRTPAASIQQVAGPEVRTKVTHLLQHGVRIELRRSRAEQAPLTVLHQVTISAGPPEPPERG